MKEKALAQIYILGMRVGCALDHFMCSIARAATLAGCPPPPPLTLSHQVSVNFNRILQRCVYFCIFLCIFFTAIVLYCWHCWLLCVLLRQQNFNNKNLMETQLALHLPIEPNISLVKLSCDDIH